jgi:hypothetical protein
VDPVPDTLLFFSGVATFCEVDNKYGLIFAPNKAALHLSYIAQL